MRRRHPEVVFLHWSKRAYRVEGDTYAWADRHEDDDDAELPTETSIPRFPNIEVAGPNRWKVWDLFAPKRNALVPPVDCIEVAGPVGDDVVPIIFGSGHGVYVRIDVAGHLRPLMAASQRLIPVCCEGDAIPYLALIDTSPRVWLSDDWCYDSCAVRNAPEFHDGTTLTGPVFPDDFDTHHGVHFVGNYGNVFLSLGVWNSLCKTVSNVAQWLDVSRIVVDNELRE